MQISSHQKFDVKKKIIILFARKGLKESIPSFLMCVCVALIQQKYTYLLTVGTKLRKAYERQRFFASATMKLPRRNSIFYALPLYMV
jgi:hypothetical protein